MVAPFSPIDNRFETRLADAEAFLSRGLDTGTGMLGMAANPAAEAVAAGYDIPDDTVEAFNAVFAEEIAPRLIAARKAVEAGLDTWPSLKCSGCTLLVWSVAAVIVGIGAAALTSLTAEAGVVGTLAGLVGCSAEAALAFIVSLGTAIARGVADVVKAICEWTGACP